MIPLRRSLLALFVGACAALTSTAQVSYTGGTYTQDFDSLPNSGTYIFSGAGPFAFPSGGAPGWSFAKVNGSGANALFFVGTGSSNTGGVYSFGAASATDRAMGTLLSGTVGSTVGAVFTNNTGSTISQVNIQYTGEQWRYGGTSGTDKLAFEYRIGAATITDTTGGAFTAETTLDFSSKVNGTTGGTTGALVGNDAANKAVISGVLSGLSWGPGQTLAIRWSDFNVTGSDDGLAIDDFSLSTSAGPVAVAPSVTAITPASGATDVSLKSPIVVKFSSAVTTSGAWYTIVGNINGTYAATASPDAATITLTPTAIFAEGESVTVTIIGAQVKDGATNTLPMSGNASVTFTTESFTPSTIAIVQGSGTISPVVGQKVSVNGVVTGTYSSTDGAFGGFYVQTPDALQDGDPSTSEGIFVNTLTPVPSIGSAVKVAGTVEEKSSTGVTSTRLTNVAYVNTLSTGNPLPAAVTISLPFASPTALERYEGMLVTLPQTLTVTENYNLGPYGELLLSNGRLNTPTNVVAPGAQAIAYNAANLLNQVILDDSLDTSYPNPTPTLADSAGRGLTRRAGSTTAGVTGVLDQKFGGYIVEATATPTFMDANPRGNAPSPAGTLKVAIGNVLNFFNGNGAGAGFPTSRGATTFEEYQRQRAKMIAGITALAPDIMGLTEVENDRVTNGAANSYGPTSAIADIVAGLNSIAGAGTYAFVDASAVDIVTDEIHCAFIYRVATVAPVGAPAMLNHPSYNSIARNPLAQTFQQLSNGEKLTVSINHFKSKSSAATGVGATNGITPNPNNDQGDGQGSSNYVRVLQANALTAWLATDPTNSGDPDFLIIGDLNAYAKEDPVAAIENAGYVNLTEAAEGPGGYSYAFDGAFGHLDHALANDHLAAQVVDAQTWHVNSDEPPYLDYNLENKSVAQQAINVGTPYRYSDHDPVVVGLNLAPAPAADVTASLQVTRGGFVLNRKTGRYTQTITVKNTGTQAYAGPVSFVFGGLSANATVYSATGTTAVVAPVGSPYVNLAIGADNALTVGETVTLVAEFANATAAGITYTPKVLAGPGGR